MRLSAIGIIVTLALPSTLLLLTLALPAAAAVAEASNATSGQVPPSGAEACATTSGAIVKAEDIVLALKEAGPELDCRGRTIQGDLNLFELPARPGPSGKEERVITRPLNFRYAVFQGVITTWDQKKDLGDQPPVRFAEWVDSGGARFEGAVNFDGAVFEANANFGDARFHKMASFTRAIFEKPVTFRSAQFDERALFSKTRFRNETDFAIATFNWIAFFPDSTFGYPPQEGANFLYTRFNGDAVFARASFNGIARFVGTRFRGPARFSDVEFKDQAWFAGGARFDDTVTFRRAQFTKKKGQRPRAPVLFQGVVFAGDTNFADAKFGPVDFGQLEDRLSADIGADTVFQRRADFRGTKFESLGLRRVIFQSEVRFSGANLGNQLEVTDVDIAHASVHVTWDQLLNDGKPKFWWQGVFKEAKLQNGDKDARRAFFDFLATLERNFREHSQLGDAGEVHYLVEDFKRKVGVTQLGQVPRPSCA